MKRIFLLLLLFISTTAFAKVYYVAPNGKDTDSGLKNKPFATIQKAQELVNPGDTVYIRGGIYLVPADQCARKESVFNYCTYLDKSGTPNARINYWAYPGETPQFDFSQVKPEGLRVVGFQVMGNWIHIKGLEITGIKVTIVTHTESYCIYSWGSNNIFELLTMHDNQAVGIRHRGGANNLFLNCDSFRNYDSKIAGQCTMAFLLNLLASEMGMALREAAMEPHQLQDSRVPSLSTGSVSVWQSAIKPVVSILIITCRVAFGRTIQLTEILSTLIC
jgi:hypothetical protein